ncbi:MAG: exodeoxyribonuclease VII large subunit [Planctomycetota bacterium]
MADPLSADPGAGPALLSVSDLTRRIRSELEGRFSRVHVVGEISGLRRPGSGHVYLTLKDDRAQLSAVIWRSKVHSLRFEPKDGLEVVAEGQITVYEARGSYQLTIERLEPRGVGALELAFRQLKERLGAEGLFDPAKRRPLPRLPARIGVVTSPTGAAIQDILKVLRRRFRSVEVVLSPARVQGVGAAEEIAIAIRRLHRCTPRPDVMIVGRGGGSLEDLWAFNEEVVARAIHASEIPVLSAVGHEIDTTIADFVADQAAPTPSAAAEMVVPELSAWEDGLIGLGRQLHGRFRQQLDLCRERVDRLAQSRSLCDPFDRVRRMQQTLDDLQGDLVQAIRQRLALAQSRLEGLARGVGLGRLQQALDEQRRRAVDCEERLHRAMHRRAEGDSLRLRHLAGQLEALSPVAVLARGYSITLDEDGRAVRDAAQVTPGQTVETRLDRGRIHCRVERCETAESEAVRDEPARGDS